MQTEKVLLVVVLALILFSGVQAYQLNGIQNELSENKLSVGGTVRSASGGSPAPSAGSVKSLQDLPQMVGGC